jgi:hypothetical protein
MGDVTIEVRRRQRTSSLVLVAAMLSFFGVAPAQADDGYDSAFAKAVRAATDEYRLQLWANDDGYVQSTEYVTNFGVMFTNHDRFSPPDLANPTVLIFDQAGRLAACEYQFLDGAVIPPAFANVPTGAWYDIPRHLHYNIRVGNQTYYAQAEWPTLDAPTADNIKKRALMPADATLVFAFVHPKTRAFVVWAWLPNEDGLFSGINSLLP